MKTVTRRILIGLGVLVAIPVIGIAAIMISAFGRNSPIPDGMQLTPTARLIKDGFVDTTMIDLGNGTVALIDAGNDPQAKAIIAELGRRNMGPEAVVAIFLTHGHADHLNGAHALPSAQLYAMEAEVAAIEGRARFHGFLTRHMPGNPKGFHVSHALKDGETVTLGNRRIQAFAAPGHTLGSAVYLVDGVLYFGDSAGASKDGKLMSAVPYFSDDPDQNVASLKALAARFGPVPQTVQTLVFAHTGPLTGIQPLVEFAASH